MENFLNQNSLILFLILIALAITISLGLLILIKLRRADQRSRRFFSGKNGENLEDLILKQEKEIQKINQEIRDLYEASEKIYKLARKGIHRVGTIRFNPFKELGGNQSFSLALLNAKDSGVVISSLHSREGGRVYAKPIINGKSNFPLTEEEQQAIKLSKQK